MKKFSVISTLSLLALLAGCGCCNKRTCTTTTCKEETCEVQQPAETCCKEDVCEVAHVAPQSVRTSGPLSDSNVKWEKEDLA